MTDFVGNELSQQSGAPIELYTFVQGSDVFRYATGEDNQVIGANTFVAITISRSTILVGPEARQQTIDIDVKGSNEFVGQYINVQPSSKATVLIERIHRFDTPTPEVVQMFEGQIRAVAFLREGLKAKISAMPLAGALSTTIPLFTFQSPCNNVLYDSRCQVLKASFVFAGTVTAVSSDGLTLTVAGLDASKGVGFATGGLVEVPSTGEPRLILEHFAVDQIKLQLPFRNSVLGTQVNVQAGCDHSLPTCKSKFNNVINFQGHAFVPTRNPFTTGLD